MEELSSGVLVKFLQEIDVDGSTIRDHKPVLLQIRSIIPVLREGDLWPNQGFFLKVSDLSHALYVSLPQEQDEMILCNKLHLGQFIYVDKLEAAYPVPMLKGVRTLPGRHSCYGNPKNLLSVHNLEKFLGVSNLGSIVEEDNDVVEKPIERTRSDSKIGSNDEKGAKGSLSWTIEENNDMPKKKPSRSLSASKVGFNEVTSRRALNCRPQKNNCESTFAYRPRRKNTENSHKGPPKNQLVNADNDSDVESIISTTSVSSKSNRPSWKGRHMRAGDISDIPVIKHELKPPCSNLNIASIPPINFPRNDSSDESSSSKTKRNVFGIPPKSPKICNKTISASGRINEDTSDQKVTVSSTNDNNFTDTKMLWDFLPSNLVKLGKEVLRQRDIALCLLLLGPYKRLLLQRDYSNA